MGKKNKEAGDEAPADLLDIRGLSRPEQVEALYVHYKKAYDLWKSFPDGMIDGRLIETFKVLHETLIDYTTLQNLAESENENLKEWNGHGKRPGF